MDGPKIEAIRSPELICFIEKVKSGPGTESQYFFQCHITRSEIPARLPLPRLYDIATSWMQGTADVRL